MSDHTHTHQHSHSEGHHHSQESSLAGHAHVTAEGSTSQEELLALLSYMVSHNRHHAEELAELASQTNGAAAEALQNAIQAFAEGNRHLETALKLMQKP